MGKRREPAPEAGATEPEASEPEAGASAEPEASEPEAGEPERRETQYTYTCPACGCVQPLRREDVVVVE